MGFQLVKLADLDVQVWLLTSHEPTSAEWELPCAAVGALIRAKNGDVVSLRSFVVTDGGAPNARQRRQYRETFHGYPVPTSVVTQALRDPIKRGIVTVLQWLNPKVRVFEPHESLRAVEHIGIRRARFAPIWEALQAMQADLPPVEVLRLVASELGLPIPDQRLRSQMASPRPDRR